MSESDFRLEPMRIEDYDSLIALWKTVEGVGLGESDSRESIQFFLAHNPNLSLVARNMTGEIVGAVLCGHDGRRGWMYHLAVAPGHRRRGIGKAMFEKCRESLCALGLHRMNIFVFADNAAGKAFWECLGWKERDELRLMQRPTSD